MFSRQKLLQYMLYMSIFCIAGLVTGGIGGNIISACGLIAVLLLGGLRFSLIPDHESQHHDTLADIISVAFPLTKYTAAFVKDEKFISAFLYVYRMPPEKLLTFMRMINEMRQATDSEALKVINRMAKEERRKENVES